jgi:SAM-dependent methyltransferase
MTADLPRALREFEEAMPRFAAYMYKQVAKHVGKRVLDAGAGTGIYSEMLSEDGRKVVAVESDPVLLPMLHSRLDRYGAEIYSGDLGAAQGLPEFEPVDSAICLNVLEHVADDGQALRNMRERFLPGGKLVLLVPAHPRLYNRMDRAVGHFRRYREDHLVALLAQTGWIVNDVTYFNSFSIPAWFVAGNLLMKDTAGKSLSKLGDLLTPILSRLDQYVMRGRVGISLVAVATKPLP